MSYKICLVIICLIHSLILAQGRPVEEPYFLPEYYKNEESKGETEIVEIVEPPTFPSSYEIEFNYYLPYASTFQSDPLDYPVHMWVDFEDHEDEKLRVDTYDGIDKTIQTKDYDYIVNPRIDEIMCRKNEHHDTGSIDNIRLLSSEGRGLPHDMTNWTYAGIGQYSGELVNVWELTETLYGRDAYYKLYVSVDDGAPKYLSSLGQNYFSGAHYDEYIVYFTNYIPGKPDPKVFEEPPECVDNKYNSDYNKNIPKLDLDNSMVIRTNMLIPIVVSGDSEYDEFIMKYGRFHQTPNDYMHRLKIFKKNKKFIEESNLKKPYKMALNHYADWTPEEFKAVMLGTIEKTDAMQDIINEIGVTYERNPDNGLKLPKEFSWRGTPADGIVKDQAICGSCWAFAAVSAMEGAWYLATGEDVSLSEQQLCDCSWDYFNNACDGGLNYFAMLYATLEGGMMSSQMYQYKGQDDYCHFDPDLVIADFTLPGVLVPGIDNVKEGLVVLGPLAVSIDAGLQEFRFYTDGVFSEAACTNFTNHAVTLVGYGHEDGKDYWLIRNSWSTYWGAHGYIKVDMAHDCGIANNAAFAYARHHHHEEEEEEGEGDPDGTTKVNSRHHKDFGLYKPKDIDDELVAKIREDIFKAQFV